MPTITGAVNPQAHRRLAEKVSKGVSHARWKTLSSGRSGVAWNIGLNSISLALEVGEEALALTGSGRHNFWPDGGDAPAAFIKDINRKIAVVSAYRGVPDHYGPDHYGKVSYALDDNGRSKVEKFRISSHQAICVIANTEDETQFTIYTKDKTYMSMLAIFELAMATGREISISLNVPRLGRNSEAFMLGRIAHVCDVERIAIDRGLERG